MLPILENLAVVQNRIAEAARRAGRSAKDILLVGATKTVEPARIQTAVDGGLLYIGENRVQELCAKYDAVENAHWHFIGHLQTNKVKYIIDKAELIHAVDSERLLDEIERQAGKRGKIAHVLLEINASGEESKFGMPFDAAHRIMEGNEAREHVRIEGLMTIGPHTKDEATVRSAFAKMRVLYKKLEEEAYAHSKMQYLSMGMSGDFVWAIEEGANVVRVGSAIFGHRESGGNV